MGKIEWADKVWNPVTGCTKVSEGCRNCYAERFAYRFWGNQKFTDVQCHQDRLDIPHHWKKPCKIFVDSMSDLFHPDVPFEFISLVWDVMKYEPRHTFIILTKRPDIMFSYLYAKATYLPNVWFGVSVEDQKTANERIPWLLKTPAALRFVSYEPALGPVDFNLIKIKDADHPELGEPPLSIDILKGWYGGFNKEERTRLDWIIIGGETGSGARPMLEAWAQSTRDQCVLAGIPFFFKRWGSWWGKNSDRYLDGRIWSQFPEVKP